jgi:predicted metal-binding protein
MIPDKEQNELKASLIYLQQEAIRFGATDSAVIASGDIRTDDDLAALCNGEYTCPNFGLAASCPPHVEGPEQFRKWQEKSRYSITVKIELPASVMFSDERKEVMRLLHQVVAGVEKKAIEFGFSQSKAFAAGSCKPLFCEENKTCCVVADKLPCRHMDEARPSMSGFGIDVIQLMNTSGWPVVKTKQKKGSSPEDASWVAGLILVF